MIPLSNIFFVCFPTETLSRLAYIRYKRMKGKKERRRWTEAVDNHMSPISADWKSVCAAGANAAICNSIAVGKCSFSFSFGVSVLQAPLPLTLKVKSKMRNVQCLKCAPEPVFATLSLPSLQNVFLAYLLLPIRVSLVVLNLAYFAPDTRPCNS
jgi:hypothetical protein